MNIHHLELFYYVAKFGGITEAVRNMIEQTHLPAPVRMAVGAKFTEIWLVDKSGRFQLDTLTEGQH